LSGEKKQIAAYLDITPKNYDKEYYLPGVLEIIMTGDDIMTAIT